MLIQKNRWEKCHICDQQLDEMVSEFGGCGVYKTDCFQKHLEKYHKIAIDKYFTNPPDCPCGICNKQVGVRKRGANFFWKKYACGRNPGILRWSKDAKVSRCGEGNPMHGKTPWNLGMNKDNSEYGKKMQQLRLNTKTSKETKIKQSRSAKKRKIHGHTGRKHTAATKEKMRQKTLERIKNGEFKQTDTLPSRIFESLLVDMGIKFEKEYIVHCWSFDFYLPNLDILVEVDGDYFHSNPVVYPNGPQTKTQKINHYRDYKKNKFCIENNMNLIRFWERDILGDIECVQQKLLALKK